MKALIQRVTRGSVAIDGKVVGKIGQGYVVFLGVEKKDSEKEAELLAEKTANLRVLSDKDGKMNLSPLDTDGEVLVVSQFTLCADTKKGRRPSFLNAASGELAYALYQHFVDKLAKLGINHVQTGKFGAYMSVEIINDGPVTIMLDSRNKPTPGVE